MDTLLRKAKDRQWLKAYIEKYNDIWRENQSERMLKLENGAVIEYGRIEGDFYISGYSRAYWIPFLDLEFRDHKDFIVEARRNDPHYTRWTHKEPPEVQELMDKICKESHGGINRRTIIRNIDELKNHFVVDRPDGWRGDRTLWFPHIDLQYPEHKDFIIAARRNDPNFLGVGFTPESEEVQELLDREYPDRFTFYDFYDNRIFLYGLSNSLSTLRSKRVWDPELDSGLEEYRDVIIKARSESMLYEGPGSQEPEAVQAIIDRVRSEKPASAEESSNPLRATLRNLTLL